jgi:hypothetical protein
MDPSQLTRLARHYRGGPDVGRDPAISVEACLATLGPDDTTRRGKLGVRPWNGEFCVDSEDGRVDGRQRRGERDSRQPGVPTTSKRSTLAAGVLR